MYRMTLIALCLLLSACAGLPRMAREQVEPSPFEKRIADDTANQLAKLYPPAKTRLNLVSPSSDPFGTLLAAKLRGRGFGVSETVEASASSFPFTFNSEFRQSPHDVAQEPATANAVPGYELRYRIDHHADAFSRVTVRIGAAVLARAYIANGNADVIVPAGAWTYRGKREGEGK